MPTVVFALTNALAEREAALEHDAFRLRMHRAISWLRRSEIPGTDDDIAFICQWIAFNAAYAQELLGFSEKETFRQFLEQICSLDTGKMLDSIVWHTFSGPIRTLLDNQYVFQPFWDDMNKEPRGEGWRLALEKKRAQVRRALGDQNTAHVLFETFTRLYTLRNQIMHGGATCGGKVNRAQVRDSRAILAHLLPAILSVMMDAPQHFQSKPFYPVVDV